MNSALIFPILQGSRPVSYTHLSLSLSLTHSFSLLRRLFAFLTEYSIKKIALSERGNVLIKISRLGRRQGHQKAGPVESKKYLETEAVHLEYTTMIRVNACAEELFLTV